MWMGCRIGMVKSDLKALVNSGCTNCFMDLEWAKRMGLEPSPLQTLITMYNVDGMQNRNGKIRSESPCQLRMHQLLHGLGVGKKDGTGAISSADPDHNV